VNAVDVAVVLLTYNEEANIDRALGSVSGWARQVCILDSFSTDATLEIAAHYPCVIKQHTFTDFASQRNYALIQLPIESEWILFLDADEWLPEPLKDEIASLLRGTPPHDGYYLKWRLMWMGTWIRRGYYPTWILRLFRRGRARCEDRRVNEHIVVDGTVGRLHNDFVHEDRKSLSDWIRKHDDYARREAEELIRRGAGDVHAIPARLSRSQAERKRWIRERVWNRLPPLVRPWLYFAYRYLLAGGFLDGRMAFSYHFLQALWFPMLIDIRYLELKRRGGAPSAPPSPQDA
jgi:glycosyltransferase involved in cell wall biosynthesis